MALFLFLYLVFILSTGSVRLSSETKSLPDITNLINEVSKLQIALTSLQSQIQTQDQKYAAILSSLLSSMTSIKSDYNSTIKELTTIKDQVNTSVALIRNTTLRLVVTEDKIKSYGSELSHMNTSELDRELDDVSFQALMETDYSIRNAEKIKFDKVTLNQGAGYDPVSGLFTAPVPGTYMFWAHVLLMREDVSKPMFVDIYSTRGLLSRGYVKVTEYLNYNTAKPTAVALLDKGEEVWFQVSVKYTATLMGRNGSSCGGTLLHVKHSPNNS